MLRSGDPLWLEGVQAMRAKLPITLTALAGAALAFGQEWRDKGFRQERPPEHPTASPATLAIGTDDAPPVEQRKRFDYRIATLDWDGKRWELRAGTVHLKDFARESEAREALRILRDLRLTERGTVGTPEPILEYWLSDGAAPQAFGGGFRTTPFDLEHLRVERMQAAWCVRDDEHVLVTFGPHEDQARLALAIIRRYGFSRVGFVGGGVPSMMYFLAGPSRFAHSPLHPMHSRSTDAASAADSPAIGHAPTADLLPSGRQLSMPGVPPIRPVAASSERVTFDWRQVQIQQNGSAWKLVVGSYLLADFGADASAARQALEAVRYHHFTEYCTLGHGASRCGYFLCQGQAPHGLCLGVPVLPFRPEGLIVRPEPGGYVLTDGESSVVHLENSEIAQQLLQVLKLYHFNALCRVGRTDPHALTFFVRSR
jgi:hypothetical protein